MQDSDVKSTKVQHYVPQFYLRGFVDKQKQLYCVRKNGKPSFWARPKEICQKKFCYETEWEDETIQKWQKFVWQGKIESFFAQLEGHFATALNSITAKCKMNHNGTAHICSKEEHYILCYMVCNFMVRNPYLINHEYYEEEERQLLETDDFKDLDSDLKKVGFGDVKSMIRYVQKTERYGLSQDGRTFHRILNNLQDLTYAFFWSDFSFITSDCPVVYRIDGDKLVMACLPLSSHVAVSFEQVDRKYRNRCQILDAKSTAICNGQYIDYDPAKILISEKEFTLNDFPRVNKR